MEFTLYSIGDSAFLEQVMIALALLGGYDEFHDMVKIGLLVGVLGVFISAISNGGKSIEYQHVLIGYILWATLFIPTARVVIEDTYTGYTTVIDNVPLGPAAAGGIISLAGYRVTKMFEVAYDPIVPRITETEFAESLKILSKIRNTATGYGLWRNINTDAGGGFIDMKGSWINYIKDCSLKKVDLGLLNYNQLVTYPLDDSLRFNSALFGTRIFTQAGSGEGQNLNCAQAWSELIDKTQFNGSATERAFRASLGMNGSNLRAGETAFTKTTDGLNALVNGAIAASDYIRLAVLQPILLDAAAGKYNDLQDQSAALMINQAIQQRNTLWAAEQTLFMSIVRPMMAFFEAFTYAVAPVMAFVMVLGAKGIALAGKYFALVIWIQLWMPILSIVNLYIYTAASRQIMHYESKEPHYWDSLYALNSGADIMQHWIATGGLLAASTPAIALALLYGSSVTATNLAGRLNSKGNINQKYTTPDLSNNAAVLTQASQSSYTAGGGIVGSGQTFASLNSSTTYSQLASSKKAEARQISNSLNDSLIAGISSKATGEVGYQRAVNYGNMIEAGNKDAYKAIKGTAADLMKAYSVDNGHAEAMEGLTASMLSMGLQAGASKKHGNLASNTFQKLMDTAGIKYRMPNSGTETSYSAQTGITISDGESNKDNISAKVSAIFSKGLKKLASETTDAALDKTISSEFTKDTGHGYKELWSDTNASEYASAFTDSTQLSRSYEEMAKLSSQQGMKADIPLNVQARQTMQSPELTTQLLQTVNRVGMALGPGSGFTEAVNRSAAIFQTQRGVSDEKQAYVMAAYQTLMTPSAYKSNGVITAQQVQGIMQETMLTTQNIFNKSQGLPTWNLNSQDYFNYNKNKGVFNTGVDPDSQEFRQQLIPELQGMESAIEAARQRIAAKGEAITPENAHKELIEWHYQLYRDHIKNTSDNTLYEAGRDYAIVYNDEKRNDEDIKASVASILDGTTDRINDTIDSMVTRGGVRWEFFGRFSDELANLTRHIHTMTPEEAKRLTEDYEQNTGFFKQTWHTIAGLGAEIAGRGSNSVGEKPDDMSYAAYYEQLSGLGIRNLLSQASERADQQVEERLRDIQEQAYKTRLEQAEALGMNTTDGTAQIYAASFSAGMVHELTRLYKVSNPDFEPNEETYDIKEDLNTLKKSLLREETDKYGYQIDEEGQLVYHEGKPVKAWVPNDDGTITLTDDVLEEAANNIAASIHNASWTGEWAQGQLTPELILLRTLQGKQRD
ncbi:MAG: conjugal transfer protein TraG N-terminal domain-containing protein [Cellvibrionaceae bacterium]|nr:conjugal transfer protein TraG N-terminal domain-containing protein [Cellvibrionaceae bacterium]